MYQDIKPELQLASISGGTDIISCFVLGAPTLPVYRGEIQCRGLGMAVDVFDDDGNPVRRQKGELVCTKPFPVMPVGFWNDPDGAKYHAAYFERFPNVWCHGDFAELTEHNGMVIYGRSDATLNPGACASARRKSTGRWNSWRKWWNPLVIGQDWPRASTTTCGWCSS